MAKLLRPLTLLAHRLHRKPLDLGHPLIVLPTLPILGDGDFEQFGGIAIQHLIPDEFARDFPFHRFTHCQLMLSRDRHLEILPPLGQNEPGAVAVHPHDDDAGPPLRLGELEPPAIVLGINMSRHHGLSVLHNSLSGKIQRRRGLRQTAYGNRRHPEQQPPSRCAQPAHFHGLVLPYRSYTLQGASPSSPEKQTREPGRDSAGSPRTASLPPFQATYPSWTPVWTALESALPRAAWPAPARLAAGSPDCRGRAPSASPSDQRRDIPVSGSATDSCQESRSDLRPRHAARH